MSLPPGGASADLSGEILRTDRLLLRPLIAADAPAIMAGMADAASRRFLPVPVPYGPHDAEEFLAAAAAQVRAGAALRLGLQDRASGELVGTAGLFLPSGRSVAGEIGYAVFPSGRGRGVATEAARALARWGFESGLPRIEIRAAVTNPASLRVALAAGFDFEGVERGSIRAGGDELVDAAVFARLPADPDEPRPPAMPPLPPGGLSDATVTVRPMAADDLEVVLAEARDPSARRWAVAPPDEQRLRAGTERADLDWLVGRYFRTVIVDAASGTPAGTMTFHRAGPPGTALVGYGLLPQWRGRRYTTRALRLLASWAFTEARLAYLELGTDVDNVASQRTAEAAGFQFIGTSPGYLRRPDGSFADERRYGLSARRWRAQA